MLAIRSLKYIDLVKTCLREQDDKTPGPTEHHLEIWNQQCNAKYLSHRSTFLVLPAGRTLLPPDRDSLSSLQTSTLAELNLQLNNFHILWSRQPPATQDIRKFFQPIATSVTSPPPSTCHLPAHPPSICPDICPVFCQFFQVADFRCRTRRPPHQHPVRLRL